MPHPPPPPPPAASAAAPKAPYAPPRYASPRRLAPPRATRAANERRCAGTLSSMRREAGAGPRTNTGADRSSEKHVASRTWSHAPTFFWFASPAEKSAKTREASREASAPAVRTSHTRTLPSPPPVMSTYSLPRAHAAAHTAPRWPASTCVMAPETGSHKRTRGSPVPHATSPCVAPPRPRETAPFEASSPSLGTTATAYTFPPISGSGDSNAPLSVKDTDVTRVP